MKVAEVTAHAMHFQVLLFLYHQQVMELEAILVVGQAVQEFQEVHLVQKEHQDHQRILAETDNWSHLLLHSQVESAVTYVPHFLSRTQPLSTRADQMRC